MLAAEGVGNVVCLTHDDPPYDPSPLAVHGIALQDLFARHGGPDDPERETSACSAPRCVVVEAARRGEGSAVHCRGGRRPAGTVLGVALVHLGHEPKDVVTYLDRLHRARSKDGWPEHPWQAEVVRSASSS